MKYLLSLVLSMCCATLICCSCAGAQSALIRIEKATYESMQGIKKDVTSIVASTCDSQPGCSFRVFFSALNIDDIPGTNKKIRVRWKCGNRQMPEYVASENQAANLSC